MKTQSISVDRTRATQIADRLIDLGQNVIEVRHHLNSVYSTITVATDDRPTLRRQIQIILIYIYLDSLADLVSQISNNKQP